MKFLNTFLTIYLVAQTITAQTITGIVLDQTEQPVEFANVTLHSLPDSVMITGTVSDEKGNFSLSGNGTDNAFLKVSFIGYQTQIVPAISGQSIMMRAEAFYIGRIGS